MPGTYISPAETGFYLTGTRYYDPEIGRFINADKVIAGVCGDALGYNLFAYCFNNPVNMSDPTGDWPKWVGKVGNAIKNVIQTIAKGAKKVKDTVSEVCGVSLNVNEEQPISTNYYLWITTETGTGYNKNFDTGKPVNLYKTVDNIPSNLWKNGDGIDVNVNGYGGGFQVGNEKSISIHLKNSSLEVGQNTLGRNYIKHSYIDNSGLYMYNKISVNEPEIGATILLGIYAPSLALAGATGSIVISIFQ